VMTNSLSAGHSTIIVQSVTIATVVVPEFPMPGGKIA